MSTWVKDGVRWFDGSSDTWGIEPKKDKILISRKKKINKIIKKIKKDLVD